MEDSRLEQVPQFRWRRSDLLVFGIFFIGTVFFLPPLTLLFFRLFQPGLQFQDLSGVQQILMQALMDFVLVAFIFFLVRIVHGRPLLRTLYCVRSPYLRIGRMIAAGALLAITVLIVSRFLPAPSETQLEKLLTTTPSLIVFVVFGIAFAPALEEIIFRGFLYTVLADVYGSKAAVPITAVLFAALHVPLRGGNLPAVILILVVGYIFTVARQRSGSVIPSIIMHTAYNSMLFGISALFAVLADKTAN
jgi:membrane protease YdiL (CAAX protease family)